MKGSFAVAAVVLVAFALGCYRTDIIVERSPIATYPPPKDVSRAYALGLIELQGPIMTQAYCNGRPAIVYLREGLLAIGLKIITFGTYTLRQAEFICAEQGGPGVAARARHSEHASSGGGAGATSSQTPDVHARP